jgi:D-3-phosphoglycerate dehydrogenase / 2-oxoglutarate reductase
VPVPLPPGGTGAPVLVTSRSFSSGDLDLVAELEEGGCEVRTGPADHDLGALAPLLADAVAWVAGTGPVTAAHLDAAPHLHVVARYGVGTDAVDLDAAAARGVLVTNTPGANSEAVADLALALTLAALRDVVPGDRGVRAGSPTVTRGRELGSLTVGVVGFGRIGRGVARRLSGFGSRVLAYDPYLPADAAVSPSGRVADLGELVAHSDVVSLHAPGEETLVDAALLSRFRPHAVLVNTARAALVDEAAVADALRAGRLGRYAADVLAAESTGRTDSPLLADDLAAVTVFTSHAGAHTVGAVDAMGRGAVDAVLAVLADREPPNLVRPATA